MYIRGKKKDEWFGESEGSMGKKRIRKWEKAQKEGINNY